jgi:hypothetical protein
MMNPPPSNSEASGFDSGWDPGYVPQAFSVLPQSLQANFCYYDYLF